jgi:hypothetical protein
MKYFLRALAVIVSSALLFFLALKTIPIHVYDGFESPHLSRFRWSNGRFEPGAVVSEESVVRSGRRALAITVHSGDRPEAASESGAATERAELMESWWLFSRTGRTYVYSFSRRVAGRDYSRPPSSPPPLLGASPLRTGRESFPSSGSGPSNASFRETRW